MVRRGRGRGTERPGTAKPRVLNSAAEDVRSWTAHRRHLLRAVALGLAAVSLVACGNSESVAPHGVVNVVAGENFWGTVAAQIGGKHVKVTSIISSPNGDPHLYEASASDAAAVALASLVIANGGGYDEWLSQLVSSTSHAGRVVVTVQHVLGIAGSNVNPHFWYDIPRVPKVAGAIEAALAKLEPTDSKAFSANLADFDRSLEPIEAVLSHVRQRYPAAPVAETERVAGYLLQAAGLKVKSPLGFATSIEEGNDPSAADTLSMERLITGHQVKVLLYNDQTVSPVTEQVESLAKSSGLPVVTVTETMPSSYSSYQAWQLAQARALFVALGGSAS